MESAATPSYVSFGPNENCTLAVCNVTASVYQYRPSLAVNTVFIALFGLSLVGQVIQGIRWRRWSFLFAMFWGCVSEMVGYGGRVLLWQNPFSFDGFLLQIICIAIGPAFFSAAIYLTLSEIIVYLGPQNSRVSPKFYYWFFIPCDIISLTLQGAGGGLSAITSGGSNTAVAVSISGLSFQVFTLIIFVLLVIDFVISYSKGRYPKRTEPPTTRFKIFAVFLSLAIFCILIRCVYRIDELSDGYNGPLISNEDLFIGLEGVMITVAAFCLNIAHPGPVFG